MRPCIYVIANRELGMSPGKLAAQVGHATVGSWLISKPELQTAWKESHHRWHLVMEAEDANVLDAIAFYLGERDFTTHLVCDEGASEVRPFALTALGVEIVDKDDPKVKDIFGLLKTYKAAPEKRDPFLDIPRSSLNRKGKQMQDHAFLHRPDGA